MLIPLPVRDREPLNLSFSGSWIFIIAVSLIIIVLFLKLYSVVCRRSKSKIADIEGCLRFAIFMTTKGGDKEGTTIGLSVLWPS